MHNAVFDLARRLVGATDGSPRRADRFIADDAHVEHDALAARQLSAPAARRFLGRYGNPYVAVGVDDSGSTAIDWGVYGVPETFIVGGDGTILYKHVGPIDGQIIEKVLMPAIKKARQGN